MTHHVLNMLAAGVVTAGMLCAGGCESRDTQVPKDPSLAWNDAPLWYNQQGLLVPTGSVPGNSGSNNRAAKKKKGGKAEDNATLASDRTAAAANSADEEFANPGTPNVPQAPALRDRSGGPRNGSPATPKP